jgi:hypothetical protein
LWITRSRRDPGRRARLDEWDHADTQAEKQAGDKSWRSAGSAVGIAARIVIPAMIGARPATIPLAAITVRKRGLLSHG